MIETREVETREVESDHPVAVAPKAREQENAVDDLGDLWRAIKAGRLRAGAQENAVDDLGDLRGQDPSVEWAGALITITFPSQSFAPIKYGSFVVPSVALTRTIPKGSSVAEVASIKSTMIEDLRRLQDDLFDRELATYLERAKRVYKAAAQSVGE